MSAARRPRGAAASRARRTTATRPDSSGAASRASAKGKTTPSAAPARGKGEKKKASAKRAAPPEKGRARAAAQRPAATKAAPKRTGGSAAKGSGSKPAARKARPAAAPARKTKDSAGSRARSKGAKAPGTKSRPATPKARTGAKPAAKPAARPRRENAPARAGGKSAVPSKAPKTRPKASRPPAAERVKPGAKAEGARPRPKPKAKAAATAARPAAPPKSRQPGTEPLADRPAATAEPDRSPQLEEQSGEGEAKNAAVAARSKRKKPAAAAPAPAPSEPVSETATAVADGKKKRDKKPRPPAKTMQVPEPVREVLLLGDLPDVRRALSANRRRDGARGRLQPNSPDEQPSAEESREPLDAALIMNTLAVDVQPKIEDNYDYGVLDEFRDSGHCPRPTRMVNTGCGGGEASVYFAKLGFQCVGIDPDRSEVGLARERAWLAGVDIDFMVGDLFETPNLLPAESFGLAVDRGAFYQIDDERDRQRYLSNVKRLLFKGGILFLSAGFFPLDGDAKARRPRKSGRILLANEGGVVVQEMRSAGFEMIKRVLRQTADSGDLGELLLYMRK